MRCVCSTNNTPQNITVSNSILVENVHKRWMRSLCQKWIRSHSAVWAETCFPFDNDDTGHCKISITFSVQFAVRSVHSIAACFVRTDFLFRTRIECLFAWSHLPSFRFHSISLNKSKTDDDWMEMFIIIIIVARWKVFLLVYNSIPSFVAINWFTAS